MPLIATRRQTLGEHFSEGARQLWLKMQERDWSQTRLKRELGAKDGYVSRWLFGDRKPGLKNAMRIFEVLGIAPTLWDQPPAKAFSPPAPVDDSLAATGADGV